LKDKIPVILSTRVSNLKLVFMKQSFCIWMAIN